MNTSRSLLNNVHDHKNAVHSACRSIERVMDNLDQMGMKPPADKLESAVHLLMNSLEELMGSYDDDLNSRLNESKNDVGLILSGLMSMASTPTKGE